MKLLVTNFFRELSNTCEQKWEEEPSAKRLSFYLSIYIWICIYGIHVYMAIPVYLWIYSKKRRVKRSCAWCISRVTPIDTSARTHTHMNLSKEHMLVDCMFLQQNYYPWFNRARVRVFFFFLKSRVPLLNNVLLIFFPENGQCEIRIRTKA